MLYHAVCAAGSGALATCGRLLPPPPGALPSLGAILLVVMTTRAVFVELQRVYCAGLLRNCLYRPAGADDTVRWVRTLGLRLHTLGEMIIRPHTLGEMIIRLHTLGERIIGNQWTQSH